MAHRIAHGLLRVRGACARVGHEDGPVRRAYGRAEEVHLGGSFDVPGALDDVRAVGPVHLWELLLEHLPVVCGEVPLLDAHPLAAEPLLVQDVRQGHDGGLPVRVAGEAPKVLHEGLYGVVVDVKHERRLPLQGVDDRVHDLRQDVLVDVVIPRQVGDVGWGKPYDGRQVLRLHQLLQPGLVEQVLVRYRDALQVQHGRLLTSACSVLRYGRRPVMRERFVRGTPPYLRSW